MSILKFLFFTLLFFGSFNSAEAQRAKKVFAHYLPWYDADGLQFWDRAGWCYSDGGNYDCTDLSVIHYSNEPRIGEYSQFDNDVLEYHLLSAFVAGIDGFIININPASDLQKDGALQLLDRINSLKTSFPSFDFKIMVSYDDGGETNTTLITNYLTWVYDNIYDNASYSNLIFEDDVLNVPVLLTWSESNPAHYWSTIQTLFNNDVFLMIRNPINFEYSDGNFEWVNYLNTGMPMTNTTNWGEQFFEDMDWTMARQTDNGVPANTINLVKMGGVYPGFDDQNVPPFWNGGTNRYHLRNVIDGETLALTWQKQIDYTPKRLGGTDCIENPWIQIATWNDWPEGTSIEPATDATYGYTALETCRQKIATFKGITANYTSDCLEIPYFIYQHRKDGNNTTADNAITQLLNGNCTAALAILPLEWGRFEVDCFEDYSILKWKTLMEENTNYFEIEAHFQNNDWESIGKIEAKGNTHSENNYQFLIEDNYEIDLFRIKQVDLDGKFSYSEIIASNCFQNIDNQMIIAPNPNNGLFEIKLKTNNTFFYEIIDLAGKTIVKATQFQHNHVVDLNGKKGMFFIKTLNEQKEILGVSKIIID